MNDIIAQQLRLNWIQYVKAIHKILGYKSASIKLLFVLKYINFGEVIIIHGWQGQRTFTLQTLIGLAHEARVLLSQFNWNSTPSKLTESNRSETVKTLTNQELEQARMRIYQLEYMNQMLTETLDKQKAENKVLNDLRNKEMQ